MSLRYVAEIAPAAQVDVLQAATKRVRTVSCPSRQVVGNMEALEKASMIQSNPNARGHMFEYCVYDSLRSFGIPRDRIGTHIHLDRLRCVEVDIMVSPNNGGAVYFLYLKTSLRERWKQIDRDSWASISLSNDDPLSPTAVTCGLFFREKPGEGIAKCIAHGQKVHKKCYRVNHFLSVYDATRYLQLLEEIKNA